MIRIFGKDRRKLNSDIDTWIVKWTTYKYKFADCTHPYVERCFQAFTDEQEAKAFAKTLNDAMNILGITALPQARVEKQKRTSVSSYQD